jgi:hypothetical protein
VRALAPASAVADTHRVPRVFCVRAC